MTDLTQLADAVRYAAARRSVTLSELKEVQASQESLEALQVAEEEAQRFLQAVAAKTQDQVRLHIQDLVQAALDAVFPGVYYFQMEYELKRGRTETAIYLDKDGERINPMDSSGGGVVDIVAFALRLAAWSLGKSRGTIVLDEPFRFVSAGLRPVAGELIRGLSDRLGIQIIMVTHDEAMVATADRVFTVDQKQRRSRVTVTEGGAI